MKLRLPVAAIYRVINVAEFSHLAENTAKKKYYRFSILIIDFISNELLPNKLRYYLKANVN